MSQPPQEPRAHPPQSPQSVGPGYAESGASAPPGASSKLRRPLRLSALSAADAAEIAGWRYPAPYDAYNWPTWASMEAERRELGDPDLRAAQYRAVRDADGVLAGYAQLFPLDRATRLGIGLRPDLCGRGLGAEAVRLAVREARALRPDAEPDLEVETWNVRAIRAYERAGFVVDDAYERGDGRGGTVSVCVMVPAGPQT